MTFTETSTQAGTLLDQTTGTWALDPSHTRLGFSAKHAMVTTVRGQFDTFEGSLTLNGARPEESAADLTVQTTSFSTGNADRDNHVRSADFLDVEQYPTMAFASTGVKHKGGDEFVMLGDLTIRGETRPVELNIELEGVSTDPFGNDRIGFSGETVISRKNFGLTWNVALEAGGVLVSDKVKITLDVSAIKQA
ncbi:MAG TPA: YceI family protein [Actinomycetes bacterium]|nr:YceI family protein [Actinomycetes bacterium]